MLPTYVLTPGFEPGRRLGQKVLSLPWLPLHHVSLLVVRVGIAPTYQVFQTRAVTNLATLPFVC